MKDTSVLKFYLRRKSKKVIGKYVKLCNELYLNDLVKISGSLPTGDTQDQYNCIALQYVVYNMLMARCVHWQVNYQRG